MAKAAKPPEAPKHIGRDPNLAPDKIESLSSKEAAGKIGTHERDRVFEEGAKAIVYDLIGDIGLKWAKKQSKFNPVAVLVRLQEARLEHQSEEEQGREHAENMGLFAGKTATMYRATIAAEVASGTPDRDLRKYRRYLQVLEYLEAVYTGDVNKLGSIRDKHKWVVSLVESTLSKDSKAITNLLKKLVLEKLDKFPGVNPESAMEVTRLAAVKLVAAIYNQHPDVEKDERVLLTKGAISGAYRLLQERHQYFKENFSLWKEAKDFVKAYWKFIRTGKFS